MGRPRKEDVIRIEMKAETDAMIQARVAPLLPSETARYWNGAVLAAVVRAAYIQGSLDALTISEQYPELIAAVRATP